ncbi:hypothetical protein Tco_0742772 [Tanacetum coccineum]
MTPILEYLKEEILPSDVKKERAVKRKSQRFVVISRTLYKKSFLRPWLRCVRPLQANYVMREIHEGSCSMHAAVIPEEIGMPTLRTAKVDPVQNNEALEINLDLLEEKREEAAIHEAKSKAKMERYYNSKV